MITPTTETSTTSNSISRMRRPTTPGCQRVAAGTTAVATRSGSAPSAAAAAASPAAARPIRDGARAREPALYGLVQSENGFDCGKGHFVQLPTALRILEEGADDLQLALEGEQPQREWPWLGGLVGDDAVERLDDAVAQPSDHVVVVYAVASGEDAQRPSPPHVDPTRGFELVADHLLDVT